MPVIVATPVSATHSANQPQIIYEGTYGRKARKPRTPKKQEHVRLEDQKTPVNVCEHCKIFIWVKENQHNSI